MCVRGGVYSRGQWPGDDSSLHQLLLTLAGKSFKTREHVVFPSMRNFFFRLGHNDSRLTLPDVNVAKSLKNQSITCYQMLAKNRPVRPVGIFPKLPTLSHVSFWSSAHHIYLICCCMFSQSRRLLLATLAVIHHVDVLHHLNKLAPRPERSKANNMFPTKKILQLLSLL